MRRFVNTLAVIGTLGATSGLPAQGLAARVSAVNSGTVRFEFPAADGVCGNGRDNIGVRSGGRMSISQGEFRSREWESECEPGPVRIALDLSRGAVTGLRAYVGGQWRGQAAQDLGAVSAVEASDYLLALASTANESVAKEAIFPATLAQGARPWPRLLEIAKDDRRPREVRNSAVFWLGQGTAEEATKGLAEIVDADGDREVRKSAVFSLSQRPTDEAVPALLRIARTHRDPELRRSAIFWLGQTRDPRVIAYFEEVLLRR
ncbi:MAG: HEAT repeat domain-containing protein [Gemmatimonadetes bacterium]|nr:HEAT repeat domain-containing protein [Gemmatimonadota bacterium]